MLDKCINKATSISGYECQSSLAKKKTIRDEEMKAEYGSEEEKDQPEIDHDGDEQENQKN